MERPETVHHPELGLLRLHCQTLLDPDQDQALLVFTATPGTDSHEKLAMFTVIGTQQLRPEAPQP